MKKRYYMMVLLMSVVTMGAMAKPRAMKDMKRVAQQELAQTQVGVAMAKAKKSVKLLDDRQTVAVIGYEDGGFVVMATDDMYPAVLGCSESKYNPETDNENFKWWLRAVEQVAGMARTQPLKTITPDTDKYPDHVSPLLKTKWDQDSPYNNFCPSGCPTGCVATATAQVLRYLEWPKVGEGLVFTYVPFGDFDGHRYEEDITDAEYEYDLMANSYSGMTSRKQKDAVAKLMYHVGLAMKAMYESSGTGSYNESVTHGLRKNLGYPYAVTVDKDDYTEEEWMDMIYHCLSSGLPIIYGGSDESYMGHEFVLHGYNKQGKVFINWGWSGSEDGYFDLAMLLVYWGIYDFRLYQNMVLRVDPQRVSTEMVEVTVETPGTLADLLTDEQRDTVVWLKVNGPVNSTDFKTLRCMSGSNEQAKGTWGNLSVLDLSDAFVVAGGEPYFVDGDKQLVTSDNEMPYKILELIDDGVFAQCNNLERVSLEAGNGCEFVVGDNQVLSTDRTQLIEQLPSEEIGLSIPDGVKVVHPYAFSARFHYERVSIPQSVEEIGAFAFNRCFDLCRTYVFAEEPPQIDPSAIDDLDLSLRYLYVPKGSASKYKGAPGWKKYKSRIVEFDAETEGIADGIADMPVEADVYAVDGRKVRYAHEGLKGLRPGVYVVGGKKLMLR